MNSFPSLRERFISTVLALGVAASLVLLMFSSGPRAHAAAVSITALTATSTNVYVNTGFATTSRIATGDTVNFQLNLGGTPLIAPQINIFNMGSTTMSGSGTHWFYASTSVSVWTEGPITFKIGVGGTAGDATTTETQANITSGANVTYDATGPTLNSVTWADTDSSTQLSGTDTLTLTFSETMATSTITTSNVDTVLALTNSHTFGTTGHGLALSWNTAGNILTVTLGSDTTATGADTVNPTSAVKDAVGNADATVSAITLPDSTAPSAPTGLSATSFQNTIQITTLASVGASSIRYTTDGTTPTCSTGTVYSGTITLSQTTTLEAIGCDEASNASSVASAVYTRRPATGGSSSPSPSATTPPPGHSSGLSASQVSSIIAVLVSFGADSATVANVQAALSGTWTPGNGSTVSTAVHIFKSDLTTGSLGEEVRALQQYLNAHGYPIATTGPGSAGNETTAFGPLTQAALMKYQQAKGITPAAGYFGPKTRASINAGN